MEKQVFVGALKGYKKEILDLLKTCEGSSGKQLQNKTLLSRLEQAGTRWFDEFEPPLRASFGIPEEVITGYREPFGKLLELSGGRPSRAVVATILAAILKGYQADLLVPVQKHQALLLRFPSLDAVLGHVTGPELNYLAEAVECARMGKRRAAIILGWCAAVDRLHHYIEASGFGTFNQASSQMCAIQSGRYKRFNKKFQVQNLSDLRMTVFDSDLLWVLEFLGAIDANQHERLEICSTMRNTAAHPGDATVTDENVLSFFSDLDTLVLANSTFAPAASPAVPELHKED